MNDCKICVKMGYLPVHLKKWEGNRGEPRNLDVNKGELYITTVLCAKENIF